MSINNKRLVLFSPQSSMQDFESAAKEARLVGLYLDLVGYSRVTFFALSRGVLHPFWLSSSRSFIVAILLAFQVKYDGLLFMVCAVFTKRINNSSRPFTSLEANLARFTG